MTKDTIAELKRLSAEAAPGPWEYQDEWAGKVEWAFVCAAPCDDSTLLVGSVEGDPTDAALIVAMRNHLDALLDYIDKLEAVLVYAVDYAGHDKRLADALKEV